MQFLTFALFIALCALQCAAQSTATVNIPGLDDGVMVKLINHDTKSLLDSIPLKNGQISFPSDRFTPCVVDVTVNSDGYGSFILSNASITHDVIVEEVPGGKRRIWKSSGGYNDSLKILSAQINDLSKAYKDAHIDAERDSLRSVQSALIRDNIVRNSDNVYGYMLLLLDADNWNLDELQDFVRDNPALAEYNGINDIIKAKRVALATLPGQMFTDFTVNHNGTEHRLSDVVCRGDYVLVDFWASWCGPCRAEMPHIKNAYDHFRNKNLKVLGVAVSDTPERSIEAASQMELPWEIWVNGGKEVIDAYQIRTIPLLILFAPDGKILERGIRGENIISAISKYIEPEAGL